MLYVHLRNKSQVITMTAPGKAPLSGRRGHSPYYHNSLDYLLAALGTCMGGTISYYCRYNDLNPQVFESIRLSTDSDKFIIIIKRPKDLSKEHTERLTRELKSCTVSKYLSKEIDVQWEINDTPTQKLIKEPKGCCGQ